MMHKFMIPWLITFCVFFSQLGHSQWYETQGVAVTHNVSIEVARTQAVEHALKKALLVSGASVSSVQQVVNGLLTQDSISIRARGSVNALELVDEIHANNLITVTIRADIFPQEKKCFAVNFKKSLLLTRSHLLQREQANVGKIYAIDKAVTKRLGKQLNQRSAYTKTSNILNNITEFSRLNNSLASNDISLLVETLSDQSNSQYVVFSEINNISFAENATNTWSFWQQGIYPRSFAMNVYLYNGVNGERLWQKNYQASAPWKFSKRVNIDLEGDTFWQSEYGLMLDSTIEKVIQDIDDNIMCEPSRGKILQVQGNQVIIDLGRDHGLKIGDSLSLLHLNHFNDALGRTIAGFNANPLKVTVTKLTRQTATASTPDGRLFDNIQINDLAVRYEQ
jgi:hypothetical protein